MRLMSHSAPSEEQIACVCDAKSPDQASPESSALFAVFVVEATATATRSGAKSFRCRRPRLCAVRVLER
jgi:hypothetical protein